MTCRVTRVRHELSISNEIKAAVSGLDTALISAIDEAKAAGLPQGLIVGLLLAHAHVETHKMGVPMKVVEFRRENWRDASRILCKIAGQLDSGELPVCSIGVMAMRAIRPG
jgi:hypothetical protein